MKSSHLGCSAIRPSSAYIDLGTLQTRLESFCPRSLRHSPWWPGSYLLWHFGIFDRSTEYPYTYPLSATPPTLTPCTASPRKLSTLMRWTHRGIVDLQDPQSDFCRLICRKFCVSMTLCSFLTFRWNIPAQNSAIPMASANWPHHEIFPYTFYSSSKKSLYPLGQDCIFCEMVGLRW